MENASLEPAFEDFEEVFEEGVLRLYPLGVAAASGEETAAEEASGGVPAADRQVSQEQPDFYPAADFSALIAGVQDSVGAMLAATAPDLIALPEDAGLDGPDSGKQFAIVFSLGPISPSMAVPTDPFFGQQWHLTQTGVGLFDLGGIQNVWDKGFTGFGTRVLVIDDGFDYLHTDLAPNYLVIGDFDFEPATGVNDAQDAFGVDGNNHGTPVMGIIGAALDGDGAVGIAFDAELLGYRTRSVIDDTWLENIRDAIDSGWDIGGADVINISQGMANAGETVFGNSLDQSLVAAIRAAIDGASDGGRGGLGTIVVKSAGNSRGSTEVDDVDNYDVNADMWTNFTQQIVVAAVDQDGTISDYSSYGAANLISAFGTPSEVITTDRVGVPGDNATDFRFFSGT